MFASSSNNYDQNILELKKNILIENEFTIESNLLILLPDKIAEKKQYDLILLSDNFDFPTLSMIIVNCQFLLKENGLFKFKEESYFDKIASLAVNYHQDKIIKINDLSYNFIPLQEYIEPTIVTYLFDIRSLENNKNQRSVDDYINLGKFITDLPYPMIIFTEPKLYGKLFASRIAYPDKTIIFCLKLEDLYFYKYLPVINVLMKNYTIYNRSPEKDTPLYTILTANRFNFLYQAIKLNPFSSDRFLYLDFGIAHIASNPNCIHRWIRNIPEKIKTLEINPYIESVDPKLYFQYTRHNNAAGLISGSPEKLNTLIRYFNAFWKKYFPKDGIN